MRTIGRSAHNGQLTPRLHRHEPLGDHRRRRRRSMGILGKRTPGHWRKRTRTQCCFTYVEPERAYDPSVFIIPTV